MATVAAQARLTMQDAFNQLKSSVTVEDAGVFHSTKLQDVRDAARELEHNLAERQELRNLRRLEPLFDKFDGFSKAAQFLCQETPYLSWLWVGFELFPIPAFIDHNHRHQ